MGQKFTNTIEDIEGTAERCSTTFKGLPGDVKAGDLLLIDNVLTAHGRRPYTGDRRVLVAMSD